MSQNDQIILDRIISKRKANVAPKITDEEYFEIFAIGEILKNFDLDYEEIEQGIVGGGDDGGIDGIYFFINGNFITNLITYDSKGDEKIDLSPFRNNVDLKLFIIQTTRTKSFKEDVLKKLRSTSSDLFNLSISIDNLKSEYNEKLLQIVEYFRKSYKELANSLPELSVLYFYVTMGNTEEIHKKVRINEGKLKELIISLFRGVKCDFIFLGAKELLEKYSKNPLAIKQLELLETPISIKNGGYICLVSLKDYYSFIKDDKNEFITRIFDANVRDYQGSVEVNKDIQKTLSQGGTEDFCWLNNGINIVATDGKYAGKTLTLVDPNIVNGLQTSREIFNYYKNNPDKINSDNRSLLVKIVETDDIEIRNKIIRASNNQTSIGVASLRATDPLQEKIEKYFFTNELYYDRRKNYYKNLEKPKDKIISISYLAQAVMAIVLKKPNISRSRPSSLFKEEDNYKNIFDSDYNINVFLRCVEIMKRVEIFLKENKMDLLPAEKTI